MSFAPCVVIEQLVGNFMTNRQSVDVSICAAVHVAAKCRPLSLTLLHGLQTETAAVIV
jgi:hypothetical protein